MYDSKSDSKWRQKKLIKYLFAGLFGVEEEFTRCYD